MKHLIAGAMFFGFVLVGLLLARRASLPLPEHRRKAAANALIVYALIASFTAGLTQKNLWPFAEWPLIAPAVPTMNQEFHITALDSAGAEFEVDYRAWEPMAFREVSNWVGRILLRKSRTEQDVAAAWLVELLETARRRARAGGGVGYIGRRLGPFAAPYFVLHPRWWDDPAAVPHTRFVGLRVFFVSWNLVERAAGDPRSLRRVVYEYRAP
jgi:hypothetical protein